jgi:tRNA A37 methylthiotransferase MiaB
VATKKILLLADVIAPVGDDNKRHTSDYIQYRGTDFLQMALAYVPHAPLLGPVLLGTILREAGYEVNLLECAFRALQRRNLRRALSAEPDYVLLTTTFIESTALVAEQVAMVRKLAPSAKVILGGPSLLSDLPMRRLADYCVVGEGERALPALLAALERGEEPAGIPGVCYFVNGEMRFTNPALIADLDSIPFPDWGLVRRGKDEFFSMATQRGCYWRCAFCSYPANEGYKLRFLTIPRLLEEMHRNFEKYGIRRYVFADSTFTHPHERCQEFLEKVAALPFKVQWVAYGRADTITEGLARAMRLSGCEGIFFGCDSGDEGILKKMNKRFTAAEIRRGVALLKKEGVPVTASWIVGFPGETPESVRNTLDLILELRCEQNVVHTFTVYEQAPVGLRKGTFGVEGHAMHWKHESMDSRVAARWTKWVILRMLAAGLRMGTAHDISWMSTVGFEPEQTRGFFAGAQAFSARRFRLRPSRLPEGIVPAPAPDEAEFYALCEHLRGLGQEHPVFLDRG